MTTERILELLEIERECIKRSDFCDRKCDQCSLVQKTDELMEMYDALIQWIGEGIKRNDKERDEKLLNIIKNNPQWFKGGKK